MQITYLLTNLLEPLHRFDQLDQLLVEQLVMLLALLKKDIDVIIVVLN